jgi:TusA-related sulfurtransferase
MAKNQNEKTVIDTRGYSCPISVALIAKTMNTVSDGSFVEIISDDPSMKKEIEQWCVESGNIMNTVVIDNSIARFEIIKGKGYKPQSLLDMIAFFLLGVRLHIRKIFVSLFKKDTTQCLITFVSVAEGMRAHYWLQNNYPELSYTLLPVPNAITKHCGVVIGLSNLTLAKELFGLLRSNDFKVEDIYIKNNYTYHPAQ